MPFKSKAQQGAMYAAAAGNSSVGIPQGAAQSFIAHSQGQDTGALPDRVLPKKASKKRKLKAKRKAPKPGF